jgi:hypothetical protein
LFVDLETGSLKLLDHPLRELVAGVVGDVLLEQPAQQIAALADREADREHELIAEEIPLARACSFFVLGMLAALVTPVNAAAECERGLISGEVTYDGDTIELGMIA